MHAASRFAIAVVATLTWACGGASLDEQIDGLQNDLAAGDLAVVVEQVPAVLARCEADQAPAHKVWIVEKLRLQALARQGHGKQTLEQLTRLAATYKDKVDGKLYVQLGSFVDDADNAIEAIDILDAGVKQFPDLKESFDPLIKKLTAQAEASGDTDALAKLKSLGYL